MQPTRATAFAWSVLAYNLLVIAWGAVVRATGSGAGCGSHWPLCNGEVVPRGASVETLIEFSHRATSGLALLAVVALLVVAFRVFERGHPARSGAVASMILMLAEAGIGAGLVLFELVAENASMARALFMATHLGNTFLLLAALALTAWWAGGGAPVRLARRGTLLWLFALAFAALLVAGMSGAVAALGDTLFPASSIEEALAQDFSTTSHLLLRLRVLHPILAVVAGALVLVAVGTVRAVGQLGATRWAFWLRILVFVQLAAGFINVWLLAPVWLQIVHLLLADLLWIALVLTAASSLAVDGDSRTFEPLDAKPLEA